MKTRLSRFIAKRNQKQNGFTLIELMVTVSIVGILSSLALPSFTRAFESTNSSNAKQFVVDAARDCSTALIFEHPVPTVTQADAGSDVTLATYNCIETGSVVAEGGEDRWTVVIDEDGIPEFPVKSTIS
ncbi:type IV pilin protein [Synechococcus sp. UW179A]|uniref:type IV pilin protein n=1 Tax=Synechococcus sp. UW179A TaxID=2575510 RepID=UPI000E0E10E5|nr:prepilin-type N-terminal cleavage/methylation domain-containing protein [Synechococcus sp. UW179A]